MCEDQAVTCIISTKQCDILPPSLHCRKSKNIMVIQIIHYNQQCNRRVAITAHLLRHPKQKKIGLLTITATCYSIVVSLL